MRISRFNFQEKDIFFILLILLLALIPRAIYSVQYSRTSIYPVLSSSDSYYYYLWARDIGSGEYLGGNRAFMKWPLYAYFLAFVFAIFKNNILAVYFLQTLLGLINCFLVYLIARVLFNRFAAVAAALLCAFYGTFIFYEGLMMYVILSLFLNSCLFLLMLHVQNRPAMNKLFWLGVFLGICAITQANVILFGVFAVIWILKKNGLPLREAMKQFSCFVLGLSIIVGAVALRNFFVEKDFVLISGNLGFNFYLGNNPKATGKFFCPDNIVSNQEDMFRDARIIAKMETGRNLKTSQVSAFWVKKAFDFIRDKPKEFIRLLGKKTMYLFSTERFVHDIEFEFIKNKIGIFKVLQMDLSIIMPLCILGMFLGIKRHKEIALLYLVIITLSISIVAFFVTARYKAALVPFLAIFAGYGLFCIVDAVRNRLYPRIIFLFLLLALSCGFSNLEKVFAYRTKIKPIDKSEAINYHLTKAMEYEHNRDYMNALKELRFAYALAPESREVLFRTAIIYFYKNDLESAEQKFAEVAKIYPYSVDAYFNLGFIYNTERRFTEAVTMLTKAAFLDPDDARINFQLGVAYKSLADVQAAKREFNLTLEKISRWNNTDRQMVKDELKSLEK